MRNSPGGGGWSLRRQLVPVGLVDGGGRTLGLQGPIIRLGDGDAEAGGELVEAVREVHGRV